VNVAAEQVLGRLTLGSEPAQALRRTRRRLLANPQRHRVRSGL